MTITADMIPGYRTGTWKVDHAHAEIGFSVRHLAISKVRGKFERFDATVIAAENPAESSAHVTIDVTSINTGNETRDAHLRTNDFFSASEYPTIEFRSTGVRQEGGEVLLDGELTLKGVTKPITLRGEFGGIATDPTGAVKAAASGTTVINRTDFGVTWNAPLETGGMLLGEDVTLIIEAQFELQQDAA
ncbi:YceI family protein [Microcella alkaliphila]|jgi:polyisoprenoid-binding protein YceI|uniref:YceI-like domain protein n=1 Tax=Microcella alkaliphila TaxID=279828 RepID=A0A0U5BI86_9MICO|nr:YceI family protein [Microcella alkaliphila]BAU32814.1 YceI-like domain protein [Microcella alkaliphila]